MFVIPPDLLRRRCYSTQIVEDATGDTDLQKLGVGYITLQCIQYTPNIMIMIGDQ